MKTRSPLILALVVSALIAASCGGGDTQETTTLPPITTLPPATTSSSSTTTTTTMATTTTIGGTPSPLNGLPVPDESLLDRRVIGIKIDNHAAARPQSGIQEADAMYELLVEGGLTRFIALFHSADSTYLGPIRSVRPTDPTLVKFLGAPLQISGGQDWVISIANGYGVKLIGEGATTFRISSRRSPHNLYGDTTKMRARADSSGWPDDPPPPMFSFGEPSPTEGPATDIAMDWSDQPVVNWTWDGEQYLRFNATSPHWWIDADGEQGQVAFDTLVVIKARKYTARPSSGSGSAVPALETTGSGDAVAFYNGEYVTATWQRGSVEEPFRLTLADGSDLVLPPGRPLIAIFPSVQSLTYR